MATTYQPDPKGTITMTYGELQCFASAVMCIARLSEQPGSGSAIGPFGTSNFLITCPASTQTGGGPEWNPVHINGHSVGNRYGAQRAYTRTFWTRRKAQEEASQEET